MAKLQTFDDWKKNRNGSTQTASASTTANTLSKFPSIEEWQKSKQTQTTTTPTDSSVSKYAYTPTETKTSTDRHYHKYSEEDQNVVKDYAKANQKTLSDYEEERDEAKTDVKTARKAYREAVANGDAEEADRLGTELTEARRTRRQANKETKEFAKENRLASDLGDKTAREEANGMLDAATMRLNALEEKYGDTPVEEWGWADRQEYNHWVPIYNENKTKVENDSYGFLGKLWKSVEAGATGFASGAVETAGQATAAQNAAAVAAAQNVDEDLYKNDLEYKALVDQGREVIAAGKDYNTSEDNKLFAASDRLAELQAETSAEADKGAGTAQTVVNDVVENMVQMAGDAMMAPFMGSSLVSMAARTFGSSAGEARRAGYNAGQQAAYGILKSAIETGTEKLTDGLGMIYGKGVATDITEEIIKKMANGSKSATALLTLVFGVLGESSEEVISGALDPVVGMVLDGTKSFTDAYGTKEARADTLGEIGYSALIGGLCGMLGSGKSALSIALSEKGISVAEQKALADTVKEEQEKADAQTAVETPVEAETVAPETDAIEEIPAERTAIAPESVESGEGVSLPPKTTNAVETQNNGEIAQTPVDPDTQFATKSQIARRGGTEETNIDNRTNADISSRTVNAFQFDNPEIKPYYRRAAAILLADLSSDATRLSGRDEMSSVIHEMMRAGLSRPDMIKALNAIITDSGMENNAKSKRVELALDRMLTEGYTPVDRTLPFMPVNSDYLNAKGQTKGSEVGDADSFLYRQAIEDQKTAALLDGEEISDEEAARIVDEMIASGEMEYIYTHPVTRHNDSDVDFETWYSEYGEGVANDIAREHGAVAEEQTAEPVQTEQTETVPQTEEAPQQTVQTAQQAPAQQTVESTPVETKGGEVERGFSENIRTDEARNEQLREFKEKNPDMYRQLKNKDVLNRALEIYDKGVDIATAELQQALGEAKAGKKFAPEYVPLAKMVADALYEQGRTATANQIISDVAAELTYAGQLGQSAVILREASPTARASAFEKLLTKLTKESGSQITKEQLADIVNRYRNASTDEQRNAILTEAQQSIADNAPSSLKEMFNALRYVNMLGNFKTQMRNVLGNGAMLVTARLKSRVNAVNQLAVNAVSNLLGRQGVARTSTLTTDSRMYREAADYFETDRADALGEGKYSDYVEASKGVADKKTVFKWNWKGEAKTRQEKILRTVADAPMWLLEKYRNLTNIAMEAGDAIFSKITYCQTLADYAKAQGYKSLSEVPEEQLSEMRDYAIKQSQEATFRDYNALSDFASNFDRDWGKTENGKSNKAAKVAGTVMKGVLPFRRTPANVAARMEEYSPLGIVNTAVKALKVKGGEATVNDVVESMSKTLTGTGLAVAGYLLAKAGIARGKTDDDDLEDFQTDARGATDYSIVLSDGTSVSADWLTPDAGAFFMGVAMQEAFEDGVQADDIISLLGATSDIALNMSFLSGLQDALTSISQFNGEVEALPEFLLNSFLSYVNQAASNGLIGQMEAASEKTRKTTYTTSDGVLPTSIQRSIGKWSAKTPGIDYQQADYIDPWGRKQDQGGLGLRIFENLFSPAYINFNTSTAVDDELERLYTATGESGVLPETVSRSKEVVKGEKMTAEEYEKYAVTKGQTALEFVTALMQSEGYDSMTDEEKAEAVKDIYTYAADRAKQEYCEGKGIEFESEYESINQLENPSEAMTAKSVWSVVDDGEDIDSISRFIKSLEGMSESTVEWMCDKYPDVNRYYQGAQAGLDAETVSEIREKYKEINGDESLKPAEKATYFSYYLDTRPDLTTEQRDLMAELNKFSSGYAVKADTYDRHTAAGLSETQAAEIYEAYTALVPPEGSENVTKVQKYQAISDMTWSTDDKMKALGCISDAPVAKYQAAIDAGMSFEEFTEFYSHLSALNTAAGSTNASNARLAETIRFYGLSTDMAKTLWKLWFKSDYDPDKNYG